jgi:uncharacterized membrane protein
MSHLVVLTFDDTSKAEEVHQVLETQEDLRHISLDDAAVVVKEKDGEVHIKNETDRGVKIGAIGGGLLGLFAGLLIGGPIVSLMVGAIGGALGGNLANLGIDHEFVKDVSNALEPGSSALFVMVRESDPEEALAALEPFEGNVYYTALPEETEEELRQILSDAESGTA